MQTKKRNTETRSPNAREFLRQSFRSSLTIPITSKTAPGKGCCRRSANLEYTTNLVAAASERREQTTSRSWETNLLNPVFAEWHAMSDVAYAVGFFVSVCNASKKENIVLLLQSNVAGGGRRSDLFSERELNEIARREVGVVLFRTGISGDNWTNRVIVIEIESAFRLSKSLKELAEAGRKRICTSPRRNSSDGRPASPLRCLRTARRK
jgi:hypothetical protein